MAPGIKKKKKEGRKEEFKKERGRRNKKGKKGRLNLKNEKNIEGRTEEGIKDRREGRRNKKGKKERKEEGIKKEKKTKGSSCWLQTGQTSSPGLPGCNKLRGKWWASVEGASGGLGQKLSVQGAGA